jgi:hypothetical protein
LARYAAAMPPSGTAFGSRAYRRAGANPDAGWDADKINASGVLIDRDRSGFILSWAFVGALIYAFVPLVMEGQSFFMADQALAACCVAATIVWTGYVVRPNWCGALLFGALCSLAVLIKGNGWLLALLPLFHIIMTGRWRLLTAPRLYVALLLVALTIVPWYRLTAGISADGFNYRMGTEYAWLALKTNIVMLGQQVGVPGLLLAGWAVIAQFRQRRRNPESWIIVSAALSLVLSTLTLQSIVPVDIVDRYMAPALPAIVVLAMAGVGDLGTRLMALRRQMAGNAIALILTLSMLVPGIVHLIEREPKIGYRTAEVLAMGKAGLSAGNGPASRLSGSAAPAATSASTRITDHSAHNSRMSPTMETAPTPARASAAELWLIDGNSGAEGAFIADMATGDPELQDYAVRASKLLAESNFMGNRYRLVYADAAAVLQEVKRLGIGRVVIVRAYDQPAYGHSTQLRDAMQLPDSGYTKKLTLTHRNRMGSTEYYEAIAPVSPNIAAIRKLGLPAKAANLSNNL